MNLRVWIRNWLLKPAKGERNAFYIGGARPIAKYSMRSAQFSELARDELPDAFYVGSRNLEGQPTDAGVAHADAQAAVCLRAEDGMR